MQKVASHLREIIVQSVPQLLQISIEEASIKTDAKKWSKKQIIGHLVDSASNNQQKFVRAMQQKSLDFPGYGADHWVDSQNYQDYDWQRVIRLFEEMNFLIAHLIENVEEEQLKHKITIEGVGPFTLGFIMDDYVEHLKHHLLVVLPHANFESSFKNIYN